MILLILKFDTSIFAKIDSKNINNFLFMEPLAETTWQNDTIQYIALFGGCSYNIHACPVASVVSARGSMVY
jgi:hypothetical protein